ncbi:MAG: hydroxymyristoyl-ACP dehydratase [Desulfuromonadaceae bacterium]|nr:hydroxymyristoyl-ACP dehydratase [Desulfuromonadaceae bacterium]
MPHRYPFLLLDRIVELEQGVRGVARRGVGATCGFPQILMIECVAQLAGIVVAQAEGEGGFMASIDHAEFFGSPDVGGVLIVSAMVIKAFGRLFMIEGTVFSGADQLLAVQLTLGVGNL